MPEPAPDRTEELTALLRERILVLDGAMGTMVQTYDLEERDYRGERFRDWHCELKNNNDLLVLTRPQIVQEIHARYLEGDEIYWDGLGVPNPDVKRSERVFSFSRYPHDPGTITATANGRQERV